MNDDEKGKDAQVMKTKKTWNVKSISNSNKKYVGVANKCAT